MIKQKVIYKNKIKAQIIKIHSQRNEDLNFTWEKH